MAKAGVQSCKGELEGWKFPVEEPELYQQTMLLACVSIKRTSRNGAALAGARTERKILLISPSEMFKHRANLSTNVSQA
jgi:hypothetical protein